MEVRTSNLKTTKPMTLTGLAVVFDQPANVAGRTETIRPSALDGVSLDGVILDINHDGAGVPLARSPKTLKLTVSEQGLEFEAELPETDQGRAVYEAVKRGDLSEMSFAFDVAEDRIDGETREITRISKVYEISLVTQAAYDKTYVEARSVADMSNFNPITNSLSNTNTTETEYRSAFYKNLLGKELTDTETRAISSMRAEHRSDTFNTLSNSAAIVPETTLNEVVKQAKGANGLFDEIRLFSVPANLRVPVASPADAAAWHVEGAAVDRKDITTTAVSFKSYELLKVLSLSASVKRMELSAFERYITQELRDSLTAALDTAIIAGSGDGQPTGILTGITWTSSNSIQSNGLSDDELLRVIAMLPSGYSAGAKFAISTATLFGMVYRMKDGDARYYFTDTETGGVRRLFGFEIVLDDNLPTGTILFGNFRYYGLNIPSGIVVETSRDSGFTSGLIDYRALMMADGKPIVDKAFVKLEIAEG